MKLTSVRSQDQRRMLRANSYTFPTNDWIHKITNKKESDRCDLCTEGPLDSGRLVQDGGEPPHTNPRTYSTHVRSPISGTHRGSPPVLATDPRGIGKASGPRMEVSVYLGREMPSDYMGRNHIRLQGSTVSESNAGYDMERGTIPRVGSSPHAGRR